MRAKWFGGLLFLGGAAVLALLEAGPAALGAWCLVPAILGAVSWVERDPRTRAVPFAALVMLAAVPYALRLSGVIADNFEHPPEWDFMGFWLHARSAVRGLDFYDPVHAQTLASAFTFSDEFRREIVDIGFWYPPPSMFVFAPLGWFDPYTAFAVWSVAQVAALAAAAFLLARRIAAGGVVGMGVALALLLVCSGTWTTFVFAQSNFIALAAVLAFARRSDRASGGVWLAVAAIVKPFLLALAIVPVLRRSGRSITALVLTLAVFGAASAVVFGPRTFLHFLSADPVAAKPDWIYDEAPTQSLLAMILRAGSIECGGTTCLTQPLYLALAAVIGVTLLVLLLVRREAPAEVAVSAALAALLLVYPLSGLSYSVFLLPCVVVAWRERARLPGGAWSAALGIAAIFALAEMHDGTQTVFAYIVATVLASMLLAARGAGAAGRSPV